MSTPEAPKSNLHGFIELMSQNPGCCIDFDRFCNAICVLVMGNLADVDAAVKIIEEIGSIHHSLCLNQHPDYVDQIKYNSST